MHIPNKTAEHTPVLKFYDALKIQTNSSYDRNAWLYVPDFYSEYRYILGTKGENPLICIGINPSTAAPNDLDNTLKSVNRIASFNGFDSFLMFNVYAQRATNPDDMDFELNRELHQENLEAFEYILHSCKNSPCIWAAWGTIIEKRAYLLDCLNDFYHVAKKYNTKWFVAGAKSKNKGHPHHPLYLKKDSILESFDLEEYIHCLR